MFFRSRRRAVRCTAPFVVLAVAGAASLYGTQAASADPSDPGSTPTTQTTLTDSADLTSPIVTQGDLVNSASSPVPAGSYVYLLAEPTNATLDALEVGETASVTSVGFARTDSAGHFELRYSDPASVARFADAAGRVNLTVESLVAGQETTYHLTVPMPQASSAPEAQLRKAAAADTLHLSTVATKKASGTVSTVKNKAVNGKAAGVAATTADEDPGDDTDDTAEPQDPSYTAPPDTDTSGPGAGSGGTTTSGGVRPEGGTIACGTTLKKDLGPKVVTVGEGFISNGAKVDFTYLTNSSSSMGVAINRGGGFSVDGSSSVSSDTKEEFTQYTTAGGVRFRTKFNYKEFQWHCSAPGYGYVYTVRPTSYIGGTYPVAVAASSTPSATKCVAQTAGSKFTTNNSSATTFSAGVGISADIGINLSSHTGFSKSAELVFAFTKASRLCGTSDYPGGTPKRLVAKK